MQEETRLFYGSRRGRPRLARAMGVDIDAVDGRRWLDGSSGAPAHDLDGNFGTEAALPAGAAIAGLHLPLLLVQEGGYASDAPGRKLTSFLTGITEGAA